MDPTSPSPENADLGLVRREILEVLEATETATLSLGRNLSEITSAAQACAEDMKEGLGEVRDGGAIASVLGSQCETVHGFLTDLGGVVDEQSSVADEVLTTAASVSEAAAAVDDIAFQARLLSLNSKIEAARLPEEAQAFRAIATEMRELSESIADTNSRIRDLSRSLTPLVERVRENVQLLSHQADRFSGQLDDQRQEITQLTNTLRATAEQTVVTGDTRVAEVVDRSNRTLIDLQFQDIVSQKLRKVLRELDPEAGDGHGAGYLSEDLELDKEPAEDESASGDAASGDVLMF